MAGFMTIEEYHDEHIREDLQESDSEEDDAISEDSTDDQDDNIPFVEANSPEVDADGLSDVEATSTRFDDDSNGESGESETEAVGAVKVNPNAAAASTNGVSEDEQKSNDESDSEEDVGIRVRNSEASGTDSESRESEIEEFQASGSNGDEDEDEGPVDSQNNCIFCGQGEEDDPSEDFEPYLSCLVCGEHSHYQCARENNALGQERDSEDWLCPPCDEIGQTPESPEEKFSRPRSSAPRLVRDLLPVTRGVQKRDSHSIFAQPLISEGEDMDGFRKLRKRKSPTNDLPGSAEKKRRKATPRALSEAVSNKQVDDDEMDELTTSPLTGPSGSTRRASQKNVPLIRVIQHRPLNKPPAKLILAFHLDPSKLASILGKKAKPRRGRDRKRPSRTQPPSSSAFQSPPHKFPALPTNNLIFPSILHERDHEVNSKPYGGILSEAEADTSRTLPSLRDREIFEAARKEAEEERRKASLAAESDITNPEFANNPPTTARSTRTVSGPPSKIKCIQFGRFIIDTFYAAPYPEEYSHESRLFICEFCLKYLPSEPVAYRHKLKCPAKHPPGDEIYRDGSISIWEVDGRKKTEYCQCLCLMAKMFLGSKTLYYDVEPFLFYILTEYDDLGYHFVGYFSKEKRPQSLNNVSCILVMPIHQRKGYATFLIDFSYLLTRIEGKEGSPEKPLSDMGLTAYRSYWDLTISHHLLDLVPESKSTPSFSVRTLMSRTGMTADDVIHSLERLYAFVRDPVTKTYAIRFDRKLYEQIVSENAAKGYRKMRPEKLVWTPYVMGRSDHAALDGKHMHTMAPREGSAEAEEGEARADANGDEEADEVNGTRNEQDQDDDAEPDATKSSRKPKGKGKNQGKGRFTSQSESAGFFENPSTNGAPINELGHPAPAPPSTSMLSATVSTEMTQANTDSINGTTEPVPAETRNGSHSDAPSASSTVATTTKPASERSPEEVLTGYALAYRTHNIPPSRFEIDPPIPPAMLALGRGRSKKRAFGSALGSSASARRQSNTATMNGSGAAGGTGADGVSTPSVGMMNPPASARVRSSPRHAQQVNGNGNTNGIGIEGRVGQVTPLGRLSRIRSHGNPVRRSARARDRDGKTTIDLTVDDAEKKEDDVEKDDEDSEGGRGGDSGSGSGSETSDVVEENVDVEANEGGEDDQDAESEEDAEGSGVDD
ncbi:hypothetical protein GJ744_010170 [Endocarpon pusillum]|uniref:Histone acetyltransferase n=1 Tax=Endocarpon pusillum TaxID=364733 RepID=A0A8H7AIM6_9EURO|nr:hypothetical protein GJ744_010170 [Endocarpon pusillum]